MKALPELNYFSSCREITKLLLSLFMIVSLPLVQGDTLDEEIATLDVDSAREWIDVNREILNDPRVDKVTVNRMTGEIRLLGERLEALRSELGSSATDEVRDMQIEFSLRDVELLLKQFGKSPGEAESSEEPSQGELQSKLQFQRQMERIDEIFVNESESPEMMLRAKSLLEEFRDQIAEEMLAANRSGDREAAFELVESHNHVVKLIEKAGKARTP